jgi:glycyl-tRNA synthetase beta chain
MSIGQRDLLIELGTEELPPKALLVLERALSEGITEGLAQAGLAHGAVESFATPRRLAVRVRRLATQQHEQQIRRRGPPLRAAFDAAGQPTRAAQAFADSCGVALAALAREHDAKGVEYLSYAATQPGALTASLVPGILQQALDALPIPKRMRWGSGEAQFVRPVHWLVLLFGAEVIPATMLGITSDRLTFGHRFMAPRRLRLASPASYEKTLRQRGKVVAQFAERRERIHGEVLRLAATVGGQAIAGAALLDEVSALVEWPVGVLGHFEARFLELPREVLIATLQEHQRYFAVEDTEGKLLPCFITISNIESRDESAVRIGNERVVGPRLADAAFFWDLDRRHTLTSRRAALDAVTFQAKLGSIGAKVMRIQQLAASLAAPLGADPALVEAAALSCKCDLLTSMVGEFPELQGVMGRYYALADGAPAEVAEAIREHYLPRGAGDELPRTRSGLAIAIADKLDTLAGIFAIGQKPSGTRDPFGLRRAAIGVLRMLLEAHLELDLKALCLQAASAQPAAALTTPAETVAAELYDYMMERLRSQYLENGSGLSTEMFDAVLASEPASPLDFDTRARALLGFLARPEAASLAAANKRIANILRKSPAEHTAVEAGRLAAPAEAELHAALEALRPGVEAALAQRNYTRALDELATLRPAVDAFFDQVLVNDPDAGLRANRLALLATLRSLFGRVADLSRLPG